MLEEEGNLCHSEATMVTGDRVTLHIKLPWCSTPNQRLLSSHCCQHRLAFAPLQGHRYQRTTGTAVWALLNRSAADRLGQLIVTPSSQRCASVLGAAMRGNALGTKTTTHEKPKSIPHYTQHCILIFPITT